MSADELDEATEIIAALVLNYCEMPDGELDSKAMSTNAAALKWLARHGQVVIEVEAGRRVIGRWSEGHLYER